MLIKKIKTFLTSVCVGLIIGLAAIGGYNVYKHFRPVEVVVGQSQIMRLKLQSIGKIKVAESERKFKRTISKGGGIFKNNLNISLRYKMSYEYDLNDIEIISEIENKRVVFLLDTDKIILGDMVLLEDSSYFDRSAISPTIKDEDIMKYKREGKNQTLKEFKEDDEFAKLAIQSLKEKLQQLAEELGFQQIEIIVK